MSHINELKRLEFFSRIWINISDHRNTQGLPVEEIKRLLPDEETIDKEYTAMAKAFFDEEFIHLSPEEMDRIADELPSGYLRFEAIRRRRYIHGKREQEK